jgi:hypothetical protein
MEDTVLRAARLVLGQVLPGAKKKAPAAWAVGAWFWWAVQGSNLRPLPCESKKTCFQINGLQKYPNNDNHLAY